MVLGLDVWVVAALAATFTVGAVVQGTVGLGLGLVGAPVTTLLAPSLMPEVLLWLALVMPLVTLVGEHDDIDWRGLAWAAPARLPGTVVGVALVAWFSVAELGIAVALMVLLAVGFTARSVRVPVNRATLVGAGLVSGVTGTATSIGGPPMAMLYQHRPPTQIRSTLAVYFVIGATFSLCGLTLASSLDTHALGIASIMVPFLVLGFAASGPLRRWIHATHLRAGILAVCALSALVLLIKSMLG